MPFCIRSAMSLTCFAESSCASTTFTSYPFSSAAASRPSFNVTKNGLFNVDTLRPITTSPSSPELPPPCAHCGGSSEQPAANTRRLKNNSTLFIDKNPLLIFSVDQHRNDDDETFDDLLIERGYADQVQSVVQHTDDQHTDQRADDAPLTAHQ